MARTGNPLELIFLYTVIYLSKPSLQSAAAVLLT